MLMVDNPVFWTPVKEEIVIPQTASILGHVQDTSYYRDNMASTPGHSQPISHYPKQSLTASKLAISLTTQGRFNAESPITVGLKSAFGTLLLFLQDR